MSSSLDLAEIWRLARPHTGEVTGVRPTARGFSTDVTAVVECEKGPFFVKAMASRPRGQRDSIMREKVVNPFVQPVSPELQWYAEDEAWVVLGFEVVEGRPSDFTPGSTDLAAVWAEGCTAWAGADPKAVDAFGAATVRMYWRFAKRKPDESWLTAMAVAAELWTTYRGLTVR